MSKPIDLVFPGKINENEWITFVNQHSSGNVFNLPGFVKIYEQTPYYEPVTIFACDAKTNTLKGVIVGVIQKESNGLIGKLSSRLIIWGGPLVSENDPLIIDAILKELIRVSAKKAIYTQVRNMWYWNEVCVTVFKKNGFIEDAHLDIIHDLKKGPELIFEKFSAGRRKNIRRAEKIGLEFYQVKIHSEFLVCLDLIQQTYKNIKLPLPSLSFFQTGYDTFSESDILKVFALKYKGKIISTRLVLCFNGLVYDWYAGTSNESLIYYPNDYLPWKILKWGSESGYHTFDFGGAGSPDSKYGVRDYKLKFGGDLVKFNRFKRVNNKFLLSISTLGFYFWKILKFKK